MASKGDRHHRVHYQHGSGAEEILRPTLVTVSGRCYRKLTETTFGKRKDAETLECRGKKQLFTGRWVFCLTVQAVSPTVTVHVRESLVARHSYELCRQNAVVNFHIHNLCTHFFVAPWQGKMNSEHEAASLACQRVWLPPTWIMAWTMEDCIAHSDGIIYLFGHPGRPATCADGAFLFKIKVYLSISSLCNMLGSMVQELGELQIAYRVLKLPLVVLQHGSVGVTNTSYVSHVVVL